MVAAGKADHRWIAQSPGSVDRSNTGGSESVWQSLRNGIKPLERQVGCNISPTVTAKKACIGIRWFVNQMFVIRSHHISTCYMFIQTV